MKIPFHLSPGARQGVVLCGAYGMGNAGDDAILAAVTDALRRLDRDMPITVICRRPKGVARTFGVAAVGRMNVLGWLRAMGSAKLFILGGGGLLQDVTSRRSLWYYLLLLRTAKAMGCATQLYGVGAGPIHHDREQMWTANILNRCADVITLRDSASLAQLKSWGVRGSKRLLAADPVLGAPPQVPAERERKAGFILRSWPDVWGHVPDFAQAVRYVWERYHLPPVFLCLAPEDRRVIGDVCALLEDVPFSVSTDARRTGRMSLVISMRLHGLIFALSGGAPAAGISYDPKVDAFCTEAGLPMIALRDVTGGDLQDLIDLAMHLDGEHLSVAARTLRAREQMNINAAAQLLAGD